MIIRVVIEGLRKVLATAGDLMVTGEAHGASGAIEKTRALHPDVAARSADARRQRGAGDATVAHVDDGVAIIILTSYGDQAYVRQALEAGADGYLLKSTPPEKLIAAIRLGGLWSSSAWVLSQLDGVLLEFGGLARSKPSARPISPPMIWRSCAERVKAPPTGRSAWLQVVLEVAVKKRLQVIFQKLGAVDRASMRSPSRSGADSSKDEAIGRWLLAIGRRRLDV